MFEFDPAETIPRAVTRVLDELFDEAETRLDEMGSTDPETVVLAVHQFRKRSKELRSVARLVRPALGRTTFGRFNRLVRDSSLQLSAARDAHVMLQTLDNLVLGSPLLRADHGLGVAALRVRLVVAADAASTSLQRGDGHREEAGRLLAAARGEAATWLLPDETAPLAKGLARTFRRGVRAQRAAELDPTDELLHELRKSVKNLRYQTQLLAAHASPQVTELIERLDALGDVIGEDHDLALLIESVDRAKSTPAVTEAARARQGELRTEALTSSAQILTGAVEPFVARIMTGWLEPTRNNVAG